MKTTFITDLVTWYQSNQRQLPWRTHSTPYRTWLSEIMLQQTQVDTVIAYFNRFVEVAPNFEKLSELDEAELFKLWEGLGYYSRAKNLLKCAGIIVTHYQGQLPQHVKELIKLPGVGPYTAGAIASIAFEQPEPAVDGNVMRVMSRVFNMDCDLSNAKNRVIFENQIRPYYTQTKNHHPSEITQGLMELGALICTPKSPQCDSCPVKHHCEALDLDLVGQRPVKTPKKKQSIHQMAVALIQCNDEILITKRSEGLLSGLWGLPIAEGKDQDDCRLNLIDVLETDYGLDCVEYTCEKEPSETVKHIFTHRIWNMTVYHCQVRSKLTVDYPEIAWIKKNQKTSFALPTAFKKILER